MFYIFTVNLHIFVVSWGFGMDWDLGSWDGDLGFFGDEGTSHFTLRSSCIQTDLSVRISALTALSTDATGPTYLISS